MLYDGVFFLQTNFEFLNNTFDNFFIIQIAFVFLVQIEKDISLVIIFRKIIGFKYCQFKY